MTQLRLRARVSPTKASTNDGFDATDSITICAFTTDETDAPLFRLPVQPNDRNGLRATCRLMVDKITTVPKTTLGARVGRLHDADILRLNQAVLVCLGLAVSPRAKRTASVSPTWTSVLDFVPKSGT
jgi:mRNA interferase MazF